MPAHRALVPVPESAFGYSSPMTKEHIPGGLLIAIEGIDGAGKSTLARALGDVLERDGAEVVLSKEPTIAQEQRVDMELLLVCSLIQ